MVAKCANAGCSAEFHYLSEGKVYVWDAHAAPELRRKRRHAWLCAECAGKMTVEFDVRTGEPNVLQVA